MQMKKAFKALLFTGVSLLTAWLLFGATPARAAGETCPNGSSAPCVEDIQLNGCVTCHSIRVTGANRNGTDRIITAATGTRRHIDDTRQDWTPIVDNMISAKGSTATLELTAGYLNTNYCPTCAGPILGSPVQSAVTDSTATVTWSTSANGWEDALTDTVLFYGKNQTDVHNCTTETGCPGVSVAKDVTPVGHHVVDLTGLSCATKYFMANKAASSLGTTRSNYEISFRTKSTGPSCAPQTAIPALVYISNDESGSTAHDNVVVIDPNPLKTDHTPNPAYNTQVASIDITGQDPAEIAAHPDGSTVYVMVSERLSVIDTASNVEFTSLAGMGNLFNHLVVAPDGKKLYLAYRPTAATLNIKVFDTSTPQAPTVLMTITDPIFDGCFAPLGVAIRPDGSQLYLACRTTDSALPDRFYMVNTASNTPTLTATFTRDSTNSFTVNAFAVKPDGSQVYVARTDNNTGSKVEVFDGTSGAHVQSIPLPSGALPRAGVFSPDGSRLYVVDQSKGIHVIDAGSNTYLSTTAQTTSRGFDIGITPDGARVYTTLLGSVFANATGTNSWITTISGTYSGAANLTLTPGQSGGPPLPDVVVTAIAPNASSAIPGGTLSVTDTVKNQGEDSTLSGFEVGYVLSPTPAYDDPSAVVIGTVRFIGALAVGATDTATTNLAIPYTTLPGDYYVCALADVSEALSESNPDNNALCSAGTIHVSSPDLVMTAVTPNATSAAPGGGLSVTDTVQNQGGAATSVTFLVAYSLSPNSIYGDSDDLTITTTRAVGPLGPGASSTATTNLAMPAVIPPNNYHVCTNADSGGAVTESNEGNNTLCSTATVSVSTPDLIVSAVSTTATAVAPGGSFNLSNSVKNVGSSAVGAFTVAFHLSTNTTYGDGDDIAFAATRAVTSLNPGATSTGSTALVVPASTPTGSYYVCALADSGNTISEGDENNNSKCTATPIQVTLPDLIMTAVTPTGSVSTTAKLAVSNTLKNQGAVTAGSSKIAFSLSLNAIYGDGDDIAIVTSRTVSSLAAGASSTATTTLTLPSTTPPGNYYVCAKADSAGTVAELDEGNNTLCSAGTVPVPPPDLIISAVSTTTTVTGPGKNLSVSNSAKNQGLFPAGSFKVAFSLSPNTTYGDGDDVAIATTRSVSSLASGATSTGTTVFAIPTDAPFGVYHVCAMADSENTVNEGPNEGNNSLCSTATVQITAPDLILTAVSTTATTVLKGKTFVVSSTAKNQGALASTAFRLGFSLSPNTTYGDSDDVTVGNVRSITSLAAGASSTGNTTITVPGATPSGVYYVCSIADSLNQVIETDEGNNTRCSTTQITVP